MVGVVTVGCMGWRGSGICVFLWLGHGERNVSEHYCGIGWSVNTFVGKANASVSHTLLPVPARGGTIELDCFSLGYRDAGPPGGTLGCTLL